MCRNGAWGHPVLIDFDRSLNGVSCPSKGFCIAVGAEGSAATFREGSWHHRRTIDPAKVPLESVSCPTSAFCAAVGEDGHALMYTNGRWSDPTIIERTGTALVAPTLASVGCSSPSFCEAVDGDGNALRYAARARRRG
jgi:hypothetical protein